MRVTLLVTHLLGTGHLARAAAIADGVAAAGHEATLISGGAPTPHLAPKRARLVQLPPVRSDGVDFRRLLTPSGEPADAAYLADRRGALAAALEAATPDAFVTELYPFGRRVLSAEFDAALEGISARRPRPRVFASIRDILAPPSSAKKAAAAAEKLARWYDAVLVHGDPSVTPLTASWPTTPAIEAMLRYTGFVASAAVASDRAAAAAGPGAGEVLVSAGGGPVGRRLFEAAAAAARGRAEVWRLRIGGVDAAALIDRLRADAPPNLIVEPVAPDFRERLARAALSVNQAGYNTMLDVAAAGVRSVVIPFEEAGETEQRQRAEAFAAAYGYQIGREARLTGAALSALADSALAGAAPSGPALDLDGAARTAQAIASIVAGVDQGPKHQSSADPETARTGARRAASGGRAPRSGATAGRRTAPAEDWLEGPGRHWLATLPAGARFWWRDDDAVAATPALDRLLALSESASAPVALAVVPDRLEPSLAPALRGAATARAHAHGWRHRSHAPADQKNAEFGAHRPPAEMAAEIASARARIVAAFGDQADPIFTPPWNRIDSSLAPALAASGFRALSTFGRAPRGPAAPGLAWANTHLDPIDWRGLRAGGDRLVEAAALDRQAARAAQAAEDGAPIGLLTHHLVHDDALWAWTERFLAALAERGFSIQRLVV